MTLQRQILFVAVTITGSGSSVTVKMNPQVNSSFEATINARRSATTATTTTTSGGSIGEELERLVKLRNDGILTDAELANEKTRLLNR